MEKLTYFLLCTAACLSVVSGLTDGEMATLRRAISPIIGQCTSEFEAKQNKHEAANDEDDADLQTPCFIACVLKKLEVLDEKGYFVAEKGLRRLRFLVQNDEDFDKFNELAKKCAKVNDEPVSDGAKGCERAKLLLSCSFGNKGEFPF